MNNLRETLYKHRYMLLKKPNVVAVGLGHKVKRGKKTQDLAIVCSVAKKLPKQQLTEQDVVPPYVDGRITDVVETGIIRALKERTARWRPAPSGVSIGHEAITAGTLGCLVRKGEETFILSNNHILANSNKASIGDQILQPGPYDGGKLTMDMIARLYEFVPIKFIGGGDGCKIGSAFTSFINVGLRLTRRKTRLFAKQVTRFEKLIWQLENRVDAAIAKPNYLTDVSREILEIGYLKGWAENVGLGMNIMKSGRTTGLTVGIIEQVNVTVQVQYGEGKIALFVDQFMAGAMSAGGDSGSTVITENNYLAGLLFAGSDTTTVINPIKYVIEELGLTGLG